jgi:2-C-methyl-D-erythritol 2,4-cyclodiphosphate synthase
VGVGFDIHRLEDGDGVMLGGVKIPFHKRLVGHSDGDALSHAIIDALLGAASLGDIGQHFPDADPAYKGISSLKLLKSTAGRLKSAGFMITNIDAVVITEAPRLVAYKERIMGTIAETLGIGVSQISVKGKTAEGIGPIGAGDALSAHAVALVERIP